jgi:hypothetical protein
MKYKLAGVVMILLIATPIYGQPITVDTFPPVPSVVRTGDTFTVLYRVRYLDLTQWNEELIFFDNEIILENMQGLARPFEVVDIKRRELIYQDGEYRQDFVFTFSIIDREKGVKELPELQFRWAIKKPGQAEEDLQPSVAESVRVLINYLPTVPPDSHLDIRDGLKLGNASSMAWFYKLVVPVASFSFLGLWAFMFVRYIRTPRQLEAISFEINDSEINDLTQYLVPHSFMTVKQAKRSLIKSLKHSRNILSCSSAKWVDRQLLLTAERNVCLSTLNLLRAVFPKLNFGDTPREIEAFVKREVKDSSSKRIYLKLATNLVYYKDDLERGNPDFLKKNEPLAHFTSVLKLVRGLRFDRRLLDSWMSVFSGRSKK